MKKLPKSGIPYGLNRAGRLKKTNESAWSFSLWYPDLLEDERIDVKLKK